MQTSFAHNTITPQTSNNEFHITSRCALANILERHLHSMAQRHDVNFQQHFIHGASNGGAAKKVRSCIATYDTTTALCLAHCKVAVFFPGIKGLRGFNFTSDVP